MINQTILKETAELLNMLIKLTNKAKISDSVGNDVVIKEQLIEKLENFKCEINRVFIPDLKKEIRNCSNNSGCMKLNAFMISPQHK